jgi:hypothetical protein
MLGSFFITEGAYVIWTAFSYRKKLCMNFDKNGLAQTLGDISANSSGTDVMITIFCDF